MAQTVLQGWPEVAGAVGHLLQVAGHRENHIKVILREREEVGEQLKVADVIDQKAWAENLYEARIHG